MKSNICNINKGGLGLEAILSEVEKVSNYNGLQKKEALRLRLLAEELTGMLPELVENFDGYFWLENNENKYELHTVFSVDSLSKEKKQTLIDMSATKKNAAASGFMGKIRDIAENMLLYSEDPNANNCYGIEFLHDYDVADVYYSYAWTLEHYIEQQKQEPVSNNEEWDRLEKSIVAKLADDVIVGVKGRKVEIIIKKEF
ncbi:MAG: hypothetical protein Q4A12_03345 [Eubacteriales bacterium]|nr:hypothetical protein [Eubacteriales bacterium]